MYTIKLAGSYAAMGAREDVDRAQPVVFILPDRRQTGGNANEVIMTPTEARRLARQLNRWAKLVTS